MGSQVPLTSASPNMEANSRLSNLMKPLKHGLLSSKSDLHWSLCPKNSQDLCWAFRSSFFMDPTLNTSPEPHIPKGWMCRHPCHTWDLGLGTPWEMVSPNFHDLNGWDRTDWPQSDWGTWEPVWTGPKIFKFIRMNPPVKKKILYSPSVHIGRFLW